MSNFTALEVVGRASETQLQAGEKFNKITAKKKCLKSGNYNHEEPVDNK